MKFRGLRFTWFISSVGILATGYLVMYAIFLKAYFGTLLITINNLGEADFEFWFLPACFLFSLGGIIQYLSLKKRDR